MQEQDGQGDPRAYFAAELFHLPARYFNESLVARLEQEGLTVFSPQRDGFEFSRLIPVLSRHLPPEEVEWSINVLIYAYDLRSIRESDLVLARYDEPPDPGVDTEVAFANAMGIPVIAYRTDVRSPYGNASDRFAGMHSFPIKESQVLVIQSSSSSPGQDMDELVGKISTEAKKVLQEHPPQPHTQKPEPYRNVLEIADYLFDGVDIHTEEGLAEVAKRYMDRLDMAHGFGPREVR